VFGPGYALPELWLFWVAPIAGAIIGALLYRLLLSDD
jgi:aquaporin Z